MIYIYIYIWTGHRTEALAKKLLQYATTDVASHYQLQGFSELSLVVRSPQLQQRHICSERNRTRRLYGSRVEGLRILQTIAICLHV